MPPCREHHRSVPVVVHCFTGSREDLELMLAAGYFIGMTGWVGCRRRNG